MYEMNMPEIKIKWNKETAVTKEAYDATIKEVDLLMNKGEQSLSSAESKRLQALAVAAELYEDTYEPLPIITTH